MARIAGILQFKVNGEQYLAKGSFSYGYGRNVRTSVVGVDSIHGFTETVIPAFIEGEITDDGNLDIDVLAQINDETITLELANGKVFSLEHAWNLNQDGISVEAEESNIAVRFEGKRAKDIR